MSKKVWTAEERQAFAAKMKAARQNKNPETKKTVLTETLDTSAPTAAVPEPNPVETIVADGDVAELRRQIQELKDMQWLFLRQQGQQPEATAAVQNGKLTGTVLRYAMDKNLYPNPSARLAEEPKLARFAFTLNYELDYEISESAYTTIDNIRMKEPKFSLTLIRIMLDEDTGEDTGGRYDVCRLIFHEDPDTALTIANEMGLDVKSMDETAFLNEMRYIRMRDWLLECFYPPKPTDGKEKRDVVVNGKVVQYWTKNNEDGKGTGITKTDWDKLPRIKF